MNFKKLVLVVAAVLLAVTCIYAQQKEVSISQQSKT